MEGIGIWEREEDEPRGIARTLTVQFDADTSTFAEITECLRRGSDPESVHAEISMLSTGLATDTVGIRVGLSRVFGRELGLPVVCQKGQRLLQ